MAHEVPYRTGCCCSFNYSCGAALEVVVCYESGRRIATESACIRASAERDAEHRIKSPQKAG